MIDEQVLAAYHDSVYTCQELDNSTESYHSVILDDSQRQFSAVVEDDQDEDDHDANMIDATMDQLLEEEEEEEEEPSMFSALDELPGIFPEEEDVTTTKPVVGGTGYGGLSNLGNTCYIASALQMLASLDEFVERVRNEPVPEDDDHVENEKSLSSEKKGATLKLREAFLEVMGRLATGETLRPEEFKNAVDGRSPLFVGFQQQDSHEFLTALLVMLDEDYKIVPESHKKDDDDDDDNDRGDKEEDVGVNEEEEEMDVEGSEIATVDPKTAVIDRKHDDEDEDDEMDHFSTTLSSTKSTVPALHRFSNHSFSQLDVDEIDHLLHDTPPCCGSESSLSTLQGIVQAPSLPQCKLVGGRMMKTPSDASAVLAPYHPHDQPDDMQTDSTAAALDERDDDDNDGTVSDRSHDSDEEGDGGKNRPPPPSPLAPSPVDAYFTTVVRVRLTCDSCKYSRSQRETHRHLSLEIDGAQHHQASVQDGLRRFFAPERREVKCEKCFWGAATQTAEIVQLPRALLLHLKRFVVDVSPDYSSVSYRKDRSAVSFVEALTLEDDAGVLSELVAPDCSLPKDAGISDTAMSSFRYAIRSVVNHVGSSANFGHYTADAHRRCNGGDDDHEQRRWMRFNDDCVSTITAEQALKDSTETAYMVLYELE